METCLRSVFETGMEVEEVPESHDQVAPNPCDSKSQSETEISFRSPEVIKQNLAHLDVSNAGNERSEETESTADVEMSFNVDTKCVSTPLPAQLKTCPQCDFVSKSEKRMKNHVLIKHLGQKTYKKRNKKTSSPLSDENLHGDDKDCSDVAADTEANPTPCSDCLTIESKADLTAHILDSHVEEKLVAKADESAAENPASVDSLIALYARNDSNSDQDSNKDQEETAAKCDEVQQLPTDVKKPKQRGRPRKNKLDDSIMAVLAPSTATDEQPDEKKDVEDKGSDPERETAKNESTLEDESFLVPPPEALYAMPAREELLNALKLPPTVKDLDWNFLQAACGLEVQLNKRLDFLKTGEKAKSRRILQRQPLPDTSSTQPAGAPTESSFASTDCSSSWDNTTADGSSVVILDSSCTGSGSNSLTADDSSTMTDGGTEMSPGPSTSRGLGKFRKNLNTISLNFVTEDESVMATCNLGEPMPSLAKPIHTEGKMDTLSNSIMILFHFLYFFTLLDWSC